MGGGPIEFFYLRDDTPDLHRRAEAAHLIDNMEKPASSAHPIHEVLTRRWSPRAFDPRPVPHKVLSSIFEAARWAASSMNEQPWTYIVGVRDEDPDQFERLADTLFPGNAWARNAPVLALSVAKKTFSANGQPNRVAIHDVGAASAGLVFQAMTEGLFVHQMGGFDAEKARQTFHIPDGYEPVAMLALGYPGNPEKLDEKLKEREMKARTRKPIHEFVFRGMWGEKPF